MMTISNDPWHFPRTELAKQILGMFETGLASSLTFFAPRRMGKTEFLRNEPYRVCRRVNILRDYPDDKIKIYP